MRDLMFVAVFLPMPFICLFRPWLGMLIWSWFAFTYPAASLWGIGSTIPANMIVTLFTLIGWVLAKDEPKLPPMDRTNLLFIGLALITAISMVLSRSPEFTSIKISEYASIFIYLMLLSTFLRTPERIHAFAWVIGFSISYYAVKSSTLFLASGGSFGVSGPVGTQLEDNNHLATACLLVIPLLNYLRLHSRVSLVRLAILGAMVLTALCVIATFSRGGFIGLICVLGYLWWKSGRKVSHILLMAAGLSAAVYAASDKWVERMQTIDTAAEEDESFMGRLNSWQVYLNAAMDRPLTGVGPKALEDPRVSADYRLSMTDTSQALAAHSIYFQVMGEEGFVALGIYLFMLYTAWANGGWIAKRTRDRPELAWASDLGRMAQTSIVAFAVTGAALSLAFFDLLFSIAILLAALRRLVAKKIAVTAGAVAASPPAAAQMRPAAQAAGAD